jgi:hypothetical protein
VYSIYYKLPVESFYDCFDELISGNATLISEGMFAQTGQAMKTFMFHDRIYLDPYEITVTVIMSGTKFYCK